MGWAVGRCLTALISISGAARAQEPDRNIQFSAFGTLGEASTNTDKVEFRREAGQYDGASKKADWSLDSRYGVQVSAKLDPSLLATFQVVSKYRYDGTYKPEVTAASLTWSPVPNLQLRGGIIPLNNIPAGELLDLGYGYLWVRPPVEADGAQPITRMAGVDVIENFNVAPDATLEVRAYFGSTNQKATVDHLGIWDLSGSRIYGGWARWIAGSWRARIGGTILKFGANLPEPIPTQLQGTLRTFSVYLQDPKLGQAASNLDLLGRKVWNVEADLAWEEGPYQAQGVCSRSDSDAYIYTAVWRGFASFGYRVGKFVPYVTFARIVGVRPTPPAVGSLYGVTGPLAPLARATATYATTLVAATGLDQHTLAAGVRWDFASKADLKFQVDSVRANHSTTLMYNPDPLLPSTWNGHMTVMSIVLDFIFGGGR